MGPKRSGKRGPTKAEKLYQDRATYGVQQLELNDRGFWDGVTGTNFSTLLGLMAHQKIPINIINWEDIHPEVLERVWQEIGQKKKRKKELHQILSMQERRVEVQEHDDQPHKRVKLSTDEDAPSSSSAPPSQDSNEKFILKHSETLPLVYYLENPDHGNAENPVEFSEYDLCAHGDWEFDDDNEQDYEEPDAQVIESPDLVPEIFSEWPCLAHPSKRRTQHHWSNQWEKHDRKIGKKIGENRIALFANKEEYVRKVIQFHRHFNLTQKLSDIVKGLIHDFGQDSVHRSSDGYTNWFGVEASLLYERLRAEIGTGIQFVCFYVTIDGRKLWHLQEIRIYIEVDRETGEFNVVNDRDVLNMSRSWRDGGWKDGKQHGKEGLNRDTTCLLLCDNRWKKAMASARNQNIHRS